MKQHRKPPTTLFLEKIRSKTFDWNEFKQLTTPTKAEKYAHVHGLQHLGEGSSRTVFVLSSRYALKIASGLEDAGIAQNRAEAELSSNPKTKFVVARVHQHDPKFNWIVSDLVREPEDWGEIETITGVSDLDIDWITGYNRGYDDSDDDDSDEPLPQPNSLKNIWDAGRQELAENPFVKGLFALQDIGVDLDDYNSGRSEQFGITPDGRVVALDYGFTEKVAREFYEQKIPTIMSILYEKIRSKTFNLQKFKQLTTPTDMVQYAQDCKLTFINSGSSRTVFVLSSRFVLKIASGLEDAGIAQNEAESVATEQASETVKFVIPQVRQHDQEFNWIISDLVRPAEDMEEVAKHAGIHINQLWNVIDDPDIRLQDLETSLQENPFVQGIKALMNSGVSSSDLGSQTQFGITADGRAVVLDYGGTETVLDTHYRQHYNHSSSSYQ